MNKRGINEIIVVVLVILLSVIAIFFLYTPVKNLVKNSGDSQEIKNSNSEFLIKNYNYENGIVNVKVFRNTGNSDIVGIVFIFYNNTLSFQYNTTEFPGEQEERNYKIYVGTNITSVNRIDVFPLIKIDSGNDAGKTTSGGKTSMKVYSGGDGSPVVVPDNTQDFIFAYWPEGLGRVDTNLTYIEDMKNIGMTHAGIQVRYSTNSTLLNSQLQELRDKEYKLALEISAGHYDDEIAWGNDNSKFMNASCMTDTCTRRYAGNAISPNYTGILWQNTLNNVKYDVSASNPDIVLFDTEFGWLSNPYYQEQNFNLAYYHCNCDLINKTLGYGGYVSSLKARGKDLLNAAKSVNSSTKVYFFAENSEKSNDNWFWGNLDGNDLLENYGTFPAGTGDLSSPAVYVMPNLELLQKNIDVGLINNTLPWVSVPYVAHYSAYANDSTVPYDYSVSREEGRMLRKAGAKGILFWPDAASCLQSRWWIIYSWAGKPFSIADHYGYCVRHMKEVLDGFKEGDAYVEKNNIINPGFESFRIKAKGYNDTISFLIGPTQFIPVYWYWSDTNTQYSDNITFADLNLDYSFGIYSWRQTRLGNIGNRTIYSKNFTISSSEAGNYAFSIWTKSNLNSNSGIIRYFIENLTGSEQKITENNLADSWGKSSGNFALTNGNYRLKILFEDNTGIKTDILFDNVSLMKV